MMKGGGKGEIPIWPVIRVLLMIAFAAVLRLFFQLLAGGWLPAPWLSLAATVTSFGGVAFLEAWLLAKSARPWLAALPWMAGAVLGVLLWHQTGVRVL
jgi:hypothetical protein